MSDVPPLLAARGLRFARNEQPVFGPLAFSVDAGEALLVQGDNGAGKTTLLRVLAGLLRARRRRDRHRRSHRVPVAARTRHRLPRPSARAEGRPHRDGKPALPLRAAWSSPRPGAGNRDGHRRPGRLRGHARAPALRRAEEAPVAGAPVAVARAAVAARRALREPRPGRHQPGQPHGAGAPARRRRCAC